MASVVERAARGTYAVTADDVGWDEMVRTVHRQMRSLVGPTRDLEDLTQAALEQVLRALDRFEGRADLSTFTYRISANVALRHFRSWRRFFRRFELARDDARDLEAPAAVVDASDAIVERERARRLHAALAKLAPMKRVVVTLADLEELPASRIAAVLGVPEPTVRSRLRAARQDLHAILARDPLFSPEAPSADRRPPGPRWRSR